MPKRSGVTEEEVRQMMVELAERIERGGLESVTIKAMTSDGEDLEHTFSLKTEDERLAALLAIRKVLGQVH
jgi:hypothetical protein